ncbi:MAG: RNA polymerase sigma factor [Armatimonadetes bacterium]|nr:RNA polymerase sigma factor [Armatimonadota bacterium]
MMHAMTTKSRAVPDFQIEQWVETYYSQVWGFCRRILGPELASDAAQETFVTAQRKIRDYRAESTPRTFLYGIAWRISSAMLRKSKRETPIDWLENRATASPESQLIEAEVLRQALAKISPEHRMVLILKEIEQLDINEIARILGIPPGTVKSRLHHACRNLRSLLQTSEGGLK